MTNIVLLNNVDHHDLTVLTGHGAEYGDAVNQTLIFPTEWEEAQRDYPILFRRSDDGRFHSVALLGFDRDENLFLEDGAWRARHVPALHQRGPFSIGVQRDEDGNMGEPMIHVDLDHVRVGRGGQGSPVFLPQGGNSPYLEAIATVLRRVHAGSQANDALFAALTGEGLIEPVRIEIALDDSKRYVLDDFHAIGAERMALLDGDALARLHARGYLQPAIWALSSLGNVPHLIDRKNRRLAGA
ncbi:SapC family protein [Sphingomonas sp.]|uniref:SapC family protein n=1 Tax=Sphingomonas sp. TaxID=28214 RepID=UPI0035B4A32E